MFTSGREPGEPSGKTAAAGLPNPVIKRRGTLLRAVAHRKPYEA
jgi:hypothetical protein